MELFRSTCKRLFFFFLFVAVADAIRTSLGPKGMDKMVSLVLKFCEHEGRWRYCEVFCVGCHLLP